MLVIDCVSLSFGDEPLFEPLSISVQPGRITLLTAASGVGKSTLLSWVSGMADPALKAKGRIELNGNELNHLAIEKRRIGIMFQEPLMFPHLTVAGNLAFGLKHPRNTSERNAIISAQLSNIGLEGMENRDPMTLSGGQKARIALMRCLIAEPEALLLDEPFSGLDDKIRKDFAELVKQEVRARNLPVLMVSHDPRDKAYADGDNIALTPLR